LYGRRGRGVGGVSKRCADWGGGGGGVAQVGARTEMPGCSLCMGNQARVGDKTTVVSTSTRNFPNRLGKGANVYLASAELAAVAAVLGRLPTPAEYLEYARKLDATAADTYRYLNFDQLPDYTASAGRVEVSAENRAAARKRLQAA
jgi:aconitate hydratase 2/2-methylisocitrate dehydratase